MKSLRLILLIPLLGCLLDPGYQFGLAGQPSVAN
jgi:hypothetical protein